MGWLGAIIGFALLAMLARSCWRVASPVPDYWYPMTLDTATAGAWLELQVLADAETGESVPPLGELLGDARTRVREEEIGRDGVDLAREVRRARDGDRSTHIWIARRSWRGLQRTGVRSAQGTNGGS